MSGVQEILVILLVILVILYLPKIRGNTGASRKKSRSIKLPRIDFSGGMRLAIIFSILCPVAAAAFIQPWKGNLLLFIYSGIIPVAVGWGIKWVVDGYKNKHDVVIEEDDDLDDEIFK